MCQTKRTFGIELEGYTDSNIRGDYVEDWSLVSDGSLDDGDETCDDCDGSGNYSCYHCDGDGWVNCPTCDGDRYVNCDECDGSGYYMVECEDCGGIGGDEDEYGNWENCPTCNGDGEVEMKCDNCDDDGDVSCSDCNGSGREDCEDCDGDGVRECSNCDGRGSFDSGDSLYGVECVSKVLVEDEIHAIDRIFDYTDRYGWEVNRDCGTHVHVGTDDLTIGHLQKLAIFTHIIEPTIYGMNGAHRYSGTYCKQMTMSFVNKLLNNKEMSKYEFGSAYYGWDINENTCFGKYDNARYYGLNFHSYFFRGTIEFRYFDGCDDRDMAKEIVELCLKIVEFAKNVSYEQLEYIAYKFYSAENLVVSASLLEELLSLSFNIRASSNSAYASAKQNIVGRLKILSEKEKCGIAI